MFYLYFIGLLISQDYVSAIPTAFQLQIHENTDDWIQKKTAPNVLESSAISWAGLLNFGANFVFTDQMNEGPIKKGLGLFSIDGKSIRFSVRWNSAGTISDHDLEFDFVRSGNVAHFLIASANAFDEHGKLKIENSGTLHLIPQTSYRARYNSRLIANEFPTITVPNPVGFCGGWNDGVVFGGLEFSPKTSDSLRQWFEEGANKTVFSRFGDTINVNHTYDFENTKFSREIQFRQFAGFYLKEKECYRSFKDGKLVRKKEMLALEFEPFGTVVIPKRLLMVDEVSSGQGHSIRRTEFTFGSLRQPNAADFRINGKRLSKSMEPNEIDLISTSDPHWDRLGKEQIVGSDAGIRFKPIIFKTHSQFSFKKSLLLFLCLAFVGTLLWPRNRD